MAREAARSVGAVFGNFYHLATILLRTLRPSEKLIKAVPQWSHASESRAVRRPGRQDPRNGTHRGVNVWQHTAESDARNRAGVGLVDAHPVYHTSTTTEPYPSTALGWSDGTQSPQYGTDGCGNSHSAVIFAVGTEDPEDDEEDLEQWYRYRHCLPLWATT